MVLIKLKKCLAIALVAAGMLGLGGYQALPAEEPAEKSDAKPAPQDNKGAEASPPEYLKRPVRHVSLPQVIAIALENGMPRSDDSDVFSLGSPDDMLTGLTRKQRPVQTDPIRVWAFYPASDEANIIGLPSGGIRLAHLRSCSKSP